MANTEAKKQVNAAADKSAGSNLPMFFKQPVLLDKRRHKEAGCTVTKEFGFARDTNSIPVNVMEFVEAAKIYPIVFTEGDNPQPVVIVGLEQRNYFVDDMGYWKADCYLPAYVRKYPFVFMHAPEEDQYLLCVDEASHQFKKKAEKEVRPLFEGENPSGISKAALEFCTAFQNHHKASLQFSKGLQNADLLVPNASKATLFNGREIQLGGFQIIDEKKFNELPDESILAFKQKGWLPFIYFALLSTSNWKRIVDLAAEFEPK